MPGARRPWWKSNQPHRVWAVALFFLGIWLVASISIERAKLCPGSATLCAPWASDMVLVLALLVAGIFGLLAASVRGSEDPSEEGAGGHATAPTSAGSGAGRTRTPGTR